MKRREEYENLGSCLNKALDNERIFILLGRDPVAPSVIRFWVRERVVAGCNAGGDLQLLDALECASLMEKERRGLKKAINRKRRDANTKQSS